MVIFVIFTNVSFKNHLLPLMIKSFNQRQIVHGFLRAILALIIYALTYCLFKFIFKEFIGNYYRDLPNAAQITLPILPMIFIIYKGVQRWRMGVGNLTISEASFQLPESSGLMMNIADSKLRQNVAFGYIFNSFFLAAPLQMMKAYDHFNGLIPTEFGLDAKLQALLKTITDVNKWQNFTDYPGQERELIFLINMGKVDYSPTKGKIKAVTH